MTDIFEQCYQILIEQEGRYANNPQDAGGETYKGIARNRHPEWDGWPLIDAAKMLPDFPRILEADEVLQTKVKDFYRIQFWNSIRCPDMPPPLALLVFDDAVNEGQENAARRLQTALNVKVDGDIGDITIAAANQKYSVFLLSKLSAVRLIAYTYKNDWPVFKDTWTVRMFEVYRHALSMTS